MYHTQTIDGQQLIPGAHGSALVASKSEAGGWHLVAYGHCDCAGFAFRHDCRHVRVVAQYYGLDREAELQAEAERAAPFPGVDDGQYLTIPEYLERRKGGREEF